MDSFFRTVVGVVVKRLSQSEFGSKERQRRKAGVFVYFQSYLITDRICGGDGMSRTLGASSAGRWSVLGDFRVLRGPGALQSRISLSQSSHRGTENHEDHRE